MHTLLTTVHSVLVNRFPSRIQSFLDRRHKIVCSCPHETTFADLQSCRYGRSAAAGVYARRNRRISDGRTAARSFWPGDLTRAPRIFAQPGDCNILVGAPARRVYGMATFVAQNEQGGALRARCAMKKRLFPKQKTGAGLSAKTMAGVGARIQRVRFRLDRTAQAFAALLGVAPETVERWESGRDIDRAAVTLVAAATDTPMEWLIAGLEPLQVEAIRRAVLPASTAAEATREIRFDDDRIAPQRLLTGEAMPKPLKWVSALPVEGPEPASPDSASGNARRGGRPTSFLRLPGATGAAAAARCQAPSPGRYRARHPRSPGCAGSRQPSAAATARAARPRRAHGARSRRCLLDAVY